jgi:hypothetical protein
MKVENDPINRLGEHICSSKKDNRPSQVTNHTSKKLFYKMIQIIFNLSVFIWSDHKSQNVRNFNYWKKIISSENKMVIIIEITRSVWKSFSMQTIVVQHSFIIRHKINHFSNYSHMWFFLSLCTFRSVILKPIVCYSFSIRVLFLSFLSICCLCKILNTVIDTSSHWLWLCIWGI